MKKILITGSSGFIGKMLLHRLGKKNYELLELESDLVNFEDVKSEIETKNPNIIIHLAAKTEVEKSFYYPTNFSQVNYSGTVNLIECSKSLKNLDNFIFSSTMETYGFQPISDEIKKLGYCKEHKPFNEQTEQNPNAPYAIAKLGCEYYLKYAGRAYNFPYTILRQTNTYGRSDNDFFVVEQIIIQMLKSNVCKLGYKTPYRNFIYIDDLLDLYEVVINNTKQSSKKIFCIGPDNALRIDELADMIKNKLNWNGEIIWDTKPARPGEIYYLNSTNEYVTKTLGWKPKTDLNTGLDKTINALKQRENLI
tara:strand:+ start:1054 stop:1977 length:924 start_codon:yes stop_codon:yes gene_type:complete